jgi:hypothetical protein
MCKDQRENVQIIDKIEILLKVAFNTITIQRQYIQKIMQQTSSLCLEAVAASLQEMFARSLFFQKGFRCQLNDTTLPQNNNTLLAYYISS